MKHMPFDGIVTKAITNELQEKLLNGRINKIYQPTKTELVLTIRNQRTNFHVLFSIHPSYARFHITKDSYQNPAEPPMFCMLLRKHLTGAIIESIEQDNMERVVSFRFKARDEIGDVVTRVLIMELMGRHSNLILLDEERSMIVNCLKHVPPFQNRYRTLLPGAQYIAPPAQDKLNLLTTTAESFLKKLDFNAGKIDTQIVQMLAGISPMAAKELAHRAFLGTDATYQEQFLLFQEQVKDNQFRPTIYRNKREDFHVLPITYLDGEQETFDSSNEMVDAFYSNKAERDRVKQQAKDLHQVIKNDVDKNKRKLKIHEETIKKSKNTEKTQKLGELLTANLHLVKRGDKSITVTDYYDPEQASIDIPLQTEKSPSENAQLYFKRYRKLQNAKVQAEKEFRKTTSELRYLEDITQQIEQARDQDIEAIREELRDQGYLKKQAIHKRKKKVKPKPEEYVATDGTAIFVGKNNLQNEYVTHKLADRNDTWLHTLDIPGSHVVIKSVDPSEETLIEAAILAAYHSKAQLSASVPVDYTKVKYVKKPNGAKPGFVIYTDQKSLQVTPDKHVVEGLRKK